MMNSKTQSLKDQFKTDPVGFSKDFLLKLVESELNLDKETLTKLKDLNVDANDIKETFKKLATSRLVMRKVCRVVSRSGIKHAKGWSKHAWELMSAGYNLHSLALKFGAVEGDAPDLHSPMSFSGHDETGLDSVETTSTADGGDPDDVLPPAPEPMVDIPEVPRNPFEDIEKDFLIPHMESPEIPEVPATDIADSLPVDGEGLADTISSVFE